MGVKVTRTMPPVANVLSGFDGVPRPGAAGGITLRKPVTLEQLPPEDQQRIRSQMARLDNATLELWDVEGRLVVEMKGDRRKNRKARRG